MKKIHRISLFLLLISFTLTLFGCEAPPAEGTHTEKTDIYSWINGESPIPEMRTGIKRQCITTIGKSYEFTDDGIYYITPMIGFLIYADYGVDTFVELCARPDCPHADQSMETWNTCDAYVDAPISLCYYDGYLYLFTLEGLDRMKLDGTDRQRVFNLTSLGAYSGLTQSGIWNGALTFCLKSLNDQGSEVYDFYYYKLDGSMTKPEQGGSALPYGNHDGAFIGVTVNEDGERGYDIWDPETNTVTYLCDKIGLGGYYTLEDAYIMQDSKVCLYTYADESITPLFDSGLEGKLFLHCFPDCIAISQYLNEEYTLHFYNWAFESVGNVKLDVNITIMQDALICGETADRIILAATDIGMPEYYIEKSEFGTGNINIYEYNLPYLPE